MYAVTTKDNIIDIDDVVRHMRVLDQPHIYTALTYAVPYGETIDYIVPDNEPGVSELYLPERPTGTNELEELAHLVASTYYQFRSVRDRVFAFIKFSDWDMVDFEFLVEDSAEDLIRVDRERTPDGDGWGTQRWNDEYYLFRKG